MHSLNPISETWENGAHTFLVPRVLGYQAKDFLDRKVEINCKVYRVLNARFIHTDTMKLSVEPGDRIVLTKHERKIAEKHLGKEPIITFPPDMMKPIEQTYRISSRNDKGELELNASALMEMFGIYAEEWKVSLSQIYVSIKDYTQSYTLSSQIPNPDYASEMEKHLLSVEKNNEWWKNAQTFLNRSPKRQKVDNIEIEISRLEEKLKKAKMHRDKTSQECQQEKEDLREALESNGTN